MKITRKATLVALAVFGLAFAALIYGTTGFGKTAAQIESTPTPYHNGFPSPAASPSDGQGHAMPLPSTQDRATQDSMTNAGIAMIQAAQSMEAASAVMVASGNQTLVDLGGHWYQDARALRDQGAWMIVAASSDSMIHDPNKARELDLANLEVNGMVMEAEGQAMADHGRAMLVQVDQLRTDGNLPSTIADDLTARGNELITTGNQMASDGKRMQEYAQNLQRSLGE